MHYQNYFHHAFRFAGRTPDLRRWNIQQEIKIGLYLKIRATPAQKTFEPSPNEASISCSSALKSLI
jgi:hypothetical protein